MTIWFMFDCHMFVRVGDETSNMEEMEAKVLELFAKDGCGTLFIREGGKESPLILQGHIMDSEKWGVTVDELKHFFCRVRARAQLV